MFSLSTSNFYQVYYTFCLSLTQRKHKPTYTETPSVIIVTHIKEGLEKVTWMFIYTCETFFVLSWLFVTQGDGGESSDVPIGKYCYVTLD